MTALDQLDTEISKVFDYVDRLNAFVEEWFQGEYSEVKARHDFEEDNKDETN